MSARRTPAPWLLLLSLAWPLHAGPAPDRINFEGVLRNASNAPLTGSFDMDFQVWSAPVGGDHVLSDLHAASGGSAVTVTGGLFNAALGGGTVSDGPGPGTYTAMLDVFRDHASVWVEVHVGAETLTPRIQVVSAGHALNAGNADLLDGLDGAAYSSVGHVHAQLTAGSGISGGPYDGGAAATLALGDLTAHWVQGAPYDIVLGSPGSELKIASSNGQPYFARLDAGPVTQDETYWLSGPTGTIWTAGNDGAGSGLEADTVDGLSSAQFLRSDAADQASALITFQGDPTGSGASQGSLHVNPTTAAANETLVGVSDNGTARFRVDKEGDTEVVGNLAAGNGGNLSTNVAAYPGLVQSTSGGGWGVYATAQDTGTGGGSITGVYGSGWASAGSNGKNAYGVYGTAMGATNTNYGVYGTATDVGVYGTSPSIGVWGVGATAGGYFDDSNTTSYAYVGTGTNKILGSGSVSFVQNHPARADRVIVYHAPEGDEVATYTRGSARLAGGVAHVRLGETFAWVTNPDIGLTAHVTPRGGDASLYVESVTTSEMVVRSADGASDAAFDFVVYGLRIGFEEVAIVGEKRRESPIPSMADHRRLYEAHPELRRFAALDRYQRMRGEAGAAAPLHTSGAKALHDAIGESSGGASPEPHRAAERRAELAAAAPTPSATAGGPAPAARPGLPLDAEGNLYGRSVRTSLPELAQYVPASGPVEAGDLLVIDLRDPSRVRVSDAASDPSVVGIAAGEPGVALEGGMAPITAADAALSARLEAARGSGDREEASRIWQELLAAFRQANAPVALSGILACKVDAGPGAIRVGDLLVTSATPGHAMRADDPAPGTVVAKALEPLAGGTGLIRVLVMPR